MQKNAKKLSTCGYYLNFKTYSWEIISEGNSILWQSPLVRVAFLMYILWSGLVQTRSVLFEMDMVSFTDELLLFLFSQLMSALGILPLTTMLTAD